MQVKHCGHHTCIYRKRTIFCCHNTSWAKFLWGLISVVTIAICLCVQFFMGLIFVGKLTHGNLSPTKGPLVPLVSTRMNMCNVLNV